MKLQKTKKNTQLLIVVLVCLVVAVSVRLFHLYFFEAPSCATVEFKEQAFPEAVLGEWHYYQAAKCKAQKIMAKRSNEMRTFVHSKKARSRAFSEEAIGFKSQVKLLKSRMPFTDKKEYEVYLHELFERYFFSEEELLEVVNLQVSQALQDLEGIENELAINLAKYVDGSNGETSFQQITNSNYQTGQSNVVFVGAKGAQHAAAGTAGTVIAGEIAALIVRRVFATGVRGVPVIGFVAGVLVDVGITAVTDPAAKVKESVDAALDELEAELMAELDEALAQLVEQRSASW